MDHLQCINLDSAEVFHQRHYRVRVGRLPVGMGGAINALRVERQCAGGVVGHGWQGHGFSGWLPGKSALDCKTEPE
ncbi:MAG: hypothetical protein Kow0077_10290 [Anaerolineae bacterium]